MGTILIGLACILMGALIGAGLNKPRCQDCHRQFPSHCGDCLAVWEGVAKAARIHSAGAP